MSNHADRLCDQTEQAQLFPTLGDEVQKDRVWTAIAAHADERALGDDISFSDRDRLVGEILRAGLQMADWNDEGITAVDPQGRLAEFFYILSNCEAFESSIRRRLKGKRVEETLIPTAEYREEYDRFREDVVNV